MRPGEPLVTRGQVMIGQAAGPAVPWGKSRWQRGSGKKNPHPGAAKLVNPCPRTVEGCGRADLHSKSKGHDSFPSKQEM